MKELLYNLATDKSNGFPPFLLKAFLVPFSYLYGAAVCILKVIRQYKPYRCECKVVSVGNITLGGTGKTPLVEYICRYLRGHGHKVAVISRGYKRRPAAYEQAAYAIMGDEAYMLQKKLGDIPVIVDNDRIRGINRAVKEYNVDTVVLDDGFQQWKVIKDLEIVVIDAMNPFGNRWLIPRGILRQPLGALKKADVFVLSKTDFNPCSDTVKAVLDNINPRAMIIETVHNPAGIYRLGIDKNEPVDPASLKDKLVSPLSAIAAPDSFEKLVLSLGMKIGASHRFMDHYDYTTLDITKIANELKEKGIDTIITTEKDAVKLLSLPLRNCQLSFLVLAVELKVKNHEERFHNRLRQLYSV